VQKTTARAYSNIALVKYWGKQDAGLRLPMNSSVAIALDQIYTTTTVEFGDQYSKDLVEIDGDQFSDEESQRVIDHLDRVRKLVGIHLKAKVVTKNNFPKGAGAASSASGFAALSLAATKAAGINLSQKDLSILARFGSGSASRSITGGVSIWYTGQNSQDSFAEAIELPKEWGLRVLLVFVGNLKSKKVSTTEGMARTKATSPYYPVAVKEAGKNLQRLINSIKDKNWSEFGQVVEDECYRLHILCMTTRPNLLYWSNETVAIFQKLLNLRDHGITGYFTVDAGPHVHIICQQSDADQIKSDLGKITGVNKIVDCGISGPAQTIDQHLF